MAESLADQLRPFRDQLRADRPEVKPVVQVTAEVVGADPVRAAGAARGRILEWLRDKQQIKGLPANAWDGEPFEVDVALDRPVTVESFENLWALRFDNPDARELGRYWRTEAVIGQLSGRTVLGIRLTVISRTWEVPFMRSVPAVVLDLVENPGLRDYGVRLTGEPEHVESDEEVEALVGVLEHAGRDRPVIVVSSGGDGVLPLDPAFLARRTAGLAHVYVISGRAAWQLSERIGKRLSVFGCAMRTYAPGFNRWDAHWDDHSLATNDWLNRRYPDRRDFIHMIAARSALRSVSIPDMEQRLPGFAKVRAELLRRRIAAARLEKTGTHERMVLLEEQNKRLQEDLQAAEELQGEVERYRQAAEEERDQIARQNYNLKVRIEQLEDARRKRGDVEQIEWPTAYEDLEEWAARYCAGRMVVMPRALRAAKKSEFKDVGLVAKGLYLLAKEYQALRCGQGSREEFERARQTLGVEVSSSGNEALLKQWPEEYEVLWGGEKRFLDMHLKRGTSREPRNCLRIYFFWDDESNQIVVGHVPGHLTNDAT
jgi:hypothetical protein